MKKSVIFLIASIISSIALSANTFTDSETGLMWQDNIEARTVTKDWQGAIDYCKNLKLAGYDDWRLPNIDELLSITDDKKSKPAIKNGFKNIVSGDYWSSSSDVSVSSNAWVVGFYAGGDGWGSKSYSYLIRCVRDSTNTSKFDSLIEYFAKEELAKIPQPPKEISIVKSEFETTKEFETRVANEKSKHAEEINEYNQKIANSKAAAKKIAIKKALQTIWGKPLLSNLRYDADNGYFVANLSFEVKKDFAKNVAIKVDRSEAKAFKDSFETLKPQAIFDFDGSNVSLKEIAVPYKDRKFAALFTDMKLDDTKVAVNLTSDFKANDDFSSNVKVSNDNVAKLDASKLQDFKELDRMLASTDSTKKDPKKWLFVIGIEKYKFTDNISYATRSAQMFADIANKKLGISKEQSFILLNNDSTQATIKTNLQKLINRVKAGDEIYFYYNGHGVPAANKNFEPFMLASDSEPDFISDEMFFSLNNIYGNLSNSKASKVVAFVDSCFSGATDGKSVLKGVAATKMKPKIVDFDKSKMVVITAGKGYQYSNGYDKKAHRMFSFFAMKNILENQNPHMQISEVYTKIKNETYEASLEEYGDLRTQEPQIEGNEKMKL